MTEEEVTEISDVQEEEIVTQEEEEMVTIWSPEASENIELNSTPCLLYTSPSPRDVEESRMPSSA